PHRVRHADAAVDAAGREALEGRVADECLLVRQHRHARPAGGDDPVEVRLDAVAEMDDVRPLGTQHRQERPGARHDVLDEPADNAGMTPEPHESTGAVVERPARRPPRSQLRRRQPHHAAIRASQRTVESRMSRLARMAVVGGDTAGGRAVAGAVVSLRTAGGRWVEQVPADADLDPYAAVVLPRSRGWKTVRERYAGPLVVVDADLLGGRPDAEFLPLLSGAPRATLAIGDTHALLPCPLPPLAGPPPGDAPRGLVARAPSGAAYALPVVVSPALRTVAGF